MEQPTTPMLKQYLLIKEQYPGTLLFFRLGDFYEMFYEDAETASRELDLVLTGREAGAGKRAPMCGIPYHASSQYISRLISKGYKVAICEQVEDPRLAKGLVKRDVVRVITPGTVIDGDFLDEKANNYIGSLCWVRPSGGRKACAGMAFADVSTGEFSATQIEAGSLEECVAELSRVQPSEIVIPPALEGSEALERLKAQAGGPVVTVYRERAFAPKEASKVLGEHFQVAAIDGLGFSECPAAAMAAGALLQYVLETQKSAVAQISRVRVYRTGEYVTLDPATRRNLEIFRRNTGGAGQGTLLSAIDRTVTSMGARMLKSWLLRPLRDVASINRRLDAVAFLFSRPQCRIGLRDAMARVYDIERLAGRVSAGTCNARDLVALRQSLEGLPEIRSQLCEMLESSPGEAPQALCDLATSLDSLEGVVGLIRAAITDDPPLLVREGRLVRDGYDERVDRLRKSSVEGKEWIARLEQEERASTGIRSLKVGFNKVFGYYIEVSRANLSLVPAHYIRKQTLADAERFVTPELKEKENEVLGADQSLCSLEYEIFAGIRDQVASHCPAIQERARAVAELDCLVSLAEAAAAGGYCRPEVDESGEIRIKDGRHAALERVMGPGRFVPNDVTLDRTGRVMLITGPNMAGKSTVLATTALIVYLAQVGSFVPASQARIGLVDAIFYRTGSYEDLSGGRSTFMVELTEAAHILNSATGDSLVLIDELGRGTSTYDGMSLAQAALEYLHDTIRCRTLFTTHYHELAGLERRLDGLRNFHVTAAERAGQITFLYKLTPGSVDRSYGVNVARMAGLPKSVVKRAAAILKTLERHSPSRPQQVSLLDAAMGCEIEPAAAAGDGAPTNDGAPTGVGAAPGGPAVSGAEAEVLAILRNLDLNNITPMDALRRLAEIQAMLDEA